MSISAATNILEEEQQTAATAAEPLPESGPVAGVAPEPRRDEIASLAHGLKSMVCAFEPR